MHAIYADRMGPALILLLLCLSGAARAAVQDEIQVYNDDINKPGEFGLELHVNTTPSGVVTPSYPGEIVTNHGVRITPEFSYGVTRDLEFGAYLPLTETDASGNYYYVGTKVRLKWLPWQPGADGTGWYAGLNQELSLIRHPFESTPWTSETKGIIGYKAKDWNVTFNPNIEWRLSDPALIGDPHFAPAFKGIFEVTKGISLGAEYYGDIGKIADPLPLNQQDHRIFAVMDYDMSPFVFNFGVGRGLTDGADKWTVKALIEIPLQPKQK